MMSIHNFDLVASSDLGLGSILVKIYRFLLYIIWGRR